VTSVKPMKKRTKKFTGWLAVIPIAIVAALLVLNVIYQKQFSPAGLILGIVIVAIIIGLLSLSNWARLNALQREHPKAFATNVVMYPQFLRQLSEATRAFGVDTTGVGRSKSGAVLLDNDKLRIFVGSGAPREVASFPARSVHKIEIADAAQGNWILDSLEFELSADDQTLLLDFCVTRKAWLGVLPLRALESQLQFARTQILGKESSLPAER
jgi:hypothetical protein